MTKMTVESSHRRSCANSSALPVQLVWKWPDVPCSGSGSPASRALPPETTRKQPGEPLKIDLQGADGVDEARARILPNPPSNPSLHAAAVARPSDAIAGPDRAQRDHLCRPTRAAWAALWGRTIIWHQNARPAPWRPDLLIYCTVVFTKDESCMPNH